MAPLFALASAALYGAADFLGGFAARLAPTATVVAVSQFAGLLLLGLILPVLPGEPLADDVAWGVLAGLFGSSGVALLYRALAIGTMGVVAPTTAVCAVIVPVGAGVLLGERPGALQVAGIGLALAAIALVSQQNAGVDPGTPARDVTARHPRAGVGLALLSGVAIGLFLLTLAQTRAEGGLWPLLAARVVSVVLFGGIALTRGTLTLSRRAAFVALGGGMLDMLANALYLVAVRQGSLTVVVTLSSLYPASTVLLARVVLRERLTVVQGLGVAAALLAVVLIVG